MIRVHMRYAVYNGVNKPCDCEVGGILCEIEFAALFGGLYIGLQWVVAGGTGLFLDAMTRLTNCALLDLL